MVRFLAGCLAAERVLAMVKRYDKRNGCSAAVFGRVLSILTFSADAMASFFSK
jgi:hypothetical protein